MTQLQQEKKTRELQPLSENELDFEKKFPNLYQKYILYRKYYKAKTGKDVNGEDYDSIIVKSMVAYFLYKGKYMVGKRRQGRKRGEKITLKEIASLLNYKSHTGAIYAIRSINRLLKFNPEYKVIDKEIKDIWFNFSFIMTHPKKTNKN
jgi:hypothetical protein